MRRRAMSSLPLWLAETSAMMVGYVLPRYSASNRNTGNTHSSYLSALSTVTQYAKGHYRAIAFTIEMLVTQSPSAGNRMVVKFHRALIVPSCLATNLVHSNRPEGIFRCCMPKLEASAFLGIRRDVKSPIRTPRARSSVRFIAQISKFKHQQVLTRILRCALKPRSDAHSS